MKKLNILYLFLVIFSLLFGIGVNKKTIQFNNIESNTKNNKAIKNNNSILPLDTTLVNTYKPTLYTLGDFATIANINSINDLIKYSSIKAKPQSLILYVDKNMNVINEQGTNLNIELKEAYSIYIKNKMIPLIYIKDMDVAEAFLNYYPYNMNILDMAIISNNSEIVKKVREENTIIRGIIDYSQSEIHKEDWFNIIKDANQSYANTIILNCNSATEEAITYIQARLKTVWVKDNDFTPLKIIEQINNGAYGLVSNNTDEIYIATNVYRKTNNLLRNLNRKSFNIAHRGLTTNYENSLEGIVEAIEKGATHIEIDVQVTKDNKLALMHDATIDRTTTGTGAISDYTSEELKQFKIDSSTNGLLEGDGVNIPLLDDILNYTTKTDVVTVIEIKTYDTNVVSLIRDCLEKYDAFDNVVIISFYPTQLELVKTILPEVPFASLGAVSYLDLANSLQKLAQMNSAVNTSIDNAYSDLNRYLIARGYSIWHWTYTNIEDIENGIKNGIQGLTNDCAELLADFSYKLYTDEEYIITNESSFEKVKVKLKCITYSNSNSIELDATPIYIEDHGDYAFAIFSASFENINTAKKTDFCIFSNPIKIVKE